MLCANLRVRLYYSQSFFTKAATWDFEFYKQEHYWRWKFCLLHSSCYIVTLKPISAPGNNENSYNCTCPNYWKYATCKHFLGLSISKELVHVPGHYSVSPIGQLKKRQKKQNLYFVFYVTKVIHHVVKMYFTVFEFASKSLCECFLACKC